MTALVVLVLALTCGAFALWRCRSAGLSATASLGFAAQRRTQREIAVGFLLPLFAASGLMAILAGLGWVDAGPAGVGWALSGPVVFYLVVSVLWDEFFYRVLLLTGLAILFRRFPGGRWIAALTGAGLLGLAQVGIPGASPLGCVIAALEALLYGVAFLATRSVWMPLILHFTWRLSLAFWGTYTTTTAADHARSGPAGIATSGTVIVMIVALLVILRRSRPGSSVLRLSVVPARDNETRRHTWRADARIEHDHASRPRRETWQHSERGSLAHATTPRKEHR